MNISFPSRTSSAFRALVILSALGRAAVGASSCSCVPINSWTTLKAVVQAALSPGASGTRPHVLLCPFNIAKTHDEAMLVLDDQIFIQCMKDNDGDECVLTSTGPDCTDAMNCMHTFEISSDNVWMQGLTLTGSQAGSIVVREEKMGVKLIDMTFQDNSSPDAQEGSIVDSRLGASTQVIDSRFISNRGTALQNRGSMMVVSSQFMDNVATPLWDSNDAIEMGGGVGGAIMNSEGSSLVMTDTCLSGNRAEANAPAVWAKESSVIDAGGNCGRENIVFGEENSGGLSDCNGIFSQNDEECAEFSSCGPDVCTQASSSRS